jgi:hypothetical protein
MKVYRLDFDIPRSQTSRVTWEVDTYEEEGFLLEEAELHGWIKKIGEEKGVLDSQKTVYIAILKPEVIKCFRRIYIDSVGNYHVKKYSIEKMDELDC